MDIRKTSRKMQQKNCLQWKKTHCLSVRWQHSCNTMPQSTSALQHESSQADNRWAGIWKLITVFI
jgi:hypothetical protein